MDTITSAQIKACYEAARDEVVGLGKSRHLVAEDLSNRQLMNKQSAYNLCGLLEHLLGIEPKRLNATGEAIEYYLDQIRTDFGAKKYANALKTLAACDKKFGAKNTTCRAAGQIAKRRQIS